jgi:hypothetical protein
MMFHLSYFERLIESVTLIARHPEYPRKSEAVDQCRQDVEDLLLDGRIDPEQAEVLREILGTYPGKSGHCLPDGRQVGRSRPDHGRARWLAG